MIKDINNIDSKLLDEDDRIAAYIKGQLSVEEEELFMKELEENPKLKEKAIVTARLVKGLNQVGEEQDKNVRGAFLASNEQGVESVAKQVTHQRAKIIPIRKASTWIAAAASVICIVWLGITYNDYKHTTGLGEEYANAFTFPSSSDTFERGAGSPTEVQKKLEKLFTSVINGEDLKNTIHELSVCWKLSTMESYNEYRNYSALIGWALTIAYLKDNNKEDAKKVLEKMTTLCDTDSPMGKKVRELREKLQ